MKTEYQRSRAIDSKLRARKTTKCGVTVTEDDWKQVDESQVDINWAVNGSIALRANRPGMIVQLDALYKPLSIKPIPYRVSNKETVTQDTTDPLTQSEVRVEFTPITDEHPEVVIETGKPNDPEYKYIKGDAEPELIKPSFHPLSDLHLAYVFTDNPEDIVPLVM